MGKIIGDNMTDDQRAELRQAIIDRLRNGGFENDAEMMEQELGASTVARLMTMIALDAVNIVTRK